jgi:hypothetical protein
VLEFCCLPYITFVNPAAREKGLRSKRKNSAGLTLLSTGVLLLLLAVSAATCYLLEGLVAVVFADSELD